MKVGIKKPNLKKSIKARTTGKLKRKVKKAINPMYGKKGMGMVNNPKKAIYNKVYNKTTIGIKDVIMPKNTKSNKSKTEIKTTTIKTENINQIKCNNTEKDVYGKKTRYIILKNNEGKIKKCKTGINWLSFILMFFAPLLRLDFKNSLIQFFILGITSSIEGDIGLFIFSCAYFYFPITYNGTYIKDLKKKGYVVEREFKNGLSL